MNIKHIQMAQVLREKVVQDFIRQLRAHTGRLIRIQIDFESIFSSDNEEVNEKAYHFFGHLLKPLEKAVKDLAANELGKNALSSKPEKISLQNNAELKQGKVSFEEGELKLTVSLTPEGMYYPRENQIRECLEASL